MYFWRSGIRFGCLSLFLIYTFTLHSQNTEDSLVQALQTAKEEEKIRLLNKLSKLYAGTAFEKSFYYGNEALLLSDELKNKKEQAVAYNNIGDAYFYHDDLDKSLENYEKALKINKSGGYKEGEANTLVNIGLIYYYRSRYEETMNYYKEALSIYTLLKDKEGIANVYNNMGGIHLIWGDYDKTLEYYNRVWKLKKQIGNEKDIASALNNIGIILQKQGKYGEAAKKHEEALAIQKKLKDKEGMSDTYNNIGLMNENRGDYELSIKNHNEALALYREIDNKRGIANSLNNIGQLYYRMEQWNKAIENYDEAIKIKEETGDKQGISEVLHNIGLIYEKLEDFNKALSYYVKSLKIKEETGDKEGVASTLQLIGNIYENRNNYEQALNCYQKSLDIAEEIGNDEKKAQLYNNIGLIYESKGQFQQALERYKKSCAIEEKLNNTKGMVESYMNIGTIYKNLEQFDFAFEYYNKCLGLAKQLKLKEKIMFAYKHISEVYSMKKDFKNALDFYSFYSKMKDSIYQDEYQKQIKDILTKYETENVAKENELLLKEKALEDEKYKKMKLGRNLLIVVGILVSLLFFLFYNRYRIKKKANTLLSSQNVEITKQKELLLQQKQEITDSIVYAKYIQSAILQSEDHIREIVSNYFILYYPRDIVSGDFYYFNRKDNKIVISAADCTGHGVPGAFMSMLGITLLNELINKTSHLTSDILLNGLRNYIINSLHQTGKYGESQDGMDIALCVLDVETNKIDFSGANNPLYLIRNGIITEFKGDPMPVAFYKKMNPFTRHEIQLHPGDAFYMFTDGFVDQFGGENGKKFKSVQLKKTLIDIQEKPISEQKTILEQIFNNWKGNYQQVDDVLMIGMKM